MSKFLIGILTLILSPTLMSCAEQSDAPRDTGGGIIDLSKWNPIDEDEVAVRLNALRSAKFTWGEEQIRDGHIIHQRIRFDGGKGFMFIQHAVSGLYSETVKDGILDKETFVEWLKRTKKVGDNSIESTNKIGAPLGAGNGYYAIATSVRNNNKCLFSKTGYKLKEALGDNDTGQFDTVVYFKYCDPLVKFEKFADFLTYMTRK